MDNKNTTESLRSLVGAIVDEMRQHNGSRLTAVRDAVREERDTLEKAVTAADWTAALRAHAVYDSMAKMTPGALVILVEIGEVIVRRFAPTNRGPAIDLVLHAIEAARTGKDVTSPA